MIYALIAMYVLGMAPAYMADMDSPQFDTFDACVVAVLWPILAVACWAYGVVKFVQRVAISIIGIFL